MDKRSIICLVGEGVRMNAIVLKHLFKTEYFYGPLSLLSLVLTHTMIIFILPLNLSHFEMLNNLDVQFASQWQS